MYLGRSVTVGGFGTGATRSTRSTRSRRGTPSPGPDKLLDDEAARQIAETRQYLDDAEELLRTETTAVGFINAKVARDPDHLGRYVPWAGTAGTRALYETREAAARGHPPAGSATRRDTHDLRGQVMGSSRSPWASRRSAPISGAT